MRTASIAFGSLLCLGTLLSFSSPADACKGDKSKSDHVTTAKADVPAQQTKAKSGTIATVSVKDLALRIADKDLKKDAKAVHVVDVNGAETRAKMGIIPGAILLSSSSKYDVKELPTDKSTSLVFYCANERCSASTKAASRAMEAGFQDVSVLPAGIAGWVADGYKTDTPRS